MLNRPSLLHLVLLHSPLVGATYWAPLVEHLESLGCVVTVPHLDRQTPLNRPHHLYHQQQILSAVESAKLPVNAVVAHSGAGSLLAMLDVQVAPICIFLDAIFPTRCAARFEWFDERTLIQKWRSVAARHQGVLPKGELAGLVQLIPAGPLRERFEASLDDVPLALYEEVIPVAKHWPLGAHGLYLHWSESYADDAERAHTVGFEVRHQPASHFRMVHQPGQLARELTDYIVYERKN